MRPGLRRAAFGIRTEPAAADRAMTMAAGLNAIAVFPAVLAFGVVICAVTISASPSFSDATGVILGSHLAPWQEAGSGRPRISWLL